MPLLSLHQNEDGNNQTVLFAVARAMYQHRALLMPIFFFLPEGPCLHRWHWLLPCFPFVLNQDLKKSCLICFQEKQCKNGINLEARKKSP